MRVLTILVASAWSYSLYSGRQQTPRAPCSLRARSLSTAFSAGRKVQVCRFQLRWLLKIPRGTDGASVVRFALEHIDGNKEDLINALNSHWKTEAFLLSLQLYRSYTNFSGTCQELWDSFFVLIGQPVKIVVIFIPNGCNRLLVLAAVKKTKLLFCIT